MNEREGYKVLMTDKQMIVMSNALEFYSRFMCGQMDEFPPEFREYMRKTKGVPSSTMDVSIQKITSDLNRLLFPDADGGSYGIGNNPIPFTDVAYDMYKVINHIKEMEDPSDSWNVNKGDPMKVSSEPLIDIKKVNINREKNMDNLDDIIE